MAATARLIVMMEEDEKAALEAQARAAKAPTAELARRRLFGRNEPEEEALLQVLAALGPAVQSACSRIDDNLAAIRRLREQRDERDRRVAERARGELSPESLAAIASRVRLKSGRAPIARRGGARP